MISSERDRTFDQWFLLVQHSSAQSDLEMINLLWKTQKEGQYF